MAYVSYTRVANASVMLLPSFVLFLLSIVLPPTADNYWRRFEVKNIPNVTSGYISQSMFEFKGVATGPGQEDKEGDNVGDSKDDWCNDDEAGAYESFGDDCCKPFRTAQALGITATVLSFCALALLLGAIVRGQSVSRATFALTGMLSFAAGVIGIALVILYDSELDEPFCGKTIKAADGEDMLEDMFGDLEYGPLFYLSMSASIVSVLAGARFFFLEDSSLDSYYAYSSIGGDTAASAAPQTSAQSETVFPGTLIF